MQTPLALREQMKQGPVLGCINVIPNMLVVEEMCASPCDFVWIDNEHGPHTMSDVSAAIGICLGYGKNPIVRVPCAEDWAVKWVLDQGARGLMFPFINTGEQARWAISACRYPLQGHRGFCVDIAAMRWGVDAATYVRRANEEIAVILQIEHREAIGNLEDIVAQQGWDMLFVGPMDLSSSYGKLGQLDDPEVSSAIDLVVKRAHEADGFVGTIGLSTEDIRRRLDQGFDFVAMVSDTSLLQAALKERWEQLGRPW
jgi:4-hydroxy-2-oxoheptanedioate aldolase